MLRVGIAVIAQLVVAAHNPAHAAEFHLDDTSTDGRIGGVAHVTDLDERADLARPGAIQALRVELVGALSRDHSWRSLPAPTRTQIVLHAPDGDVRSVREIARGWADSATLQEAITLTGHSDPLRGPDALRDVLARDIVRPLPDPTEPPFGTADVPPDARRIVISTGLQKLPDEGVPDGLIHVVELTSAARDPALSDGALRRAIRPGGGQVWRVSRIEDGVARVSRLVEGEPLRLRLDLTACKTDGDRAELTISGGLEASVLLPGSLPPCTPAATTPATHDEGSPLPWALIGGLSFAVVVFVGGGIFLVRSWAARRAPSPTPEEPPEDPPGRLLAPVDPEADVWLVVRRGSGLVGSRIPFAVGALSVGASSQNDALIDLVGISGRHARFERFPTGDLFVTDADSANGTWVHGRRLERGERGRLRGGDTIGLGPSLTLELVDERENGSEVRG